MLKNRLHTAVIFATAAFAPLSLAAGFDELKKTFESGGQQTFTPTAAKREPGKLDSKRLNLSITIKTPEGQEKERAQTLATAKKSATTNETSAASADEWTEVGQTLEEIAKTVSAMEETHKELLDFEDFFKTQPTNNNSDASVDPLKLPDSTDVSHTNTIKQLRMQKDRPKSAARRNKLEKKASS
ncbi:MAG: hypothetical protein V6Z78_04600 [Holosporaceae bacterium]